MASTTLKVTTHVGRDLLDAASSFKTEAAVVWEYVVNSLQYIDPGVAPKVQVEVDAKRKKISISDNGRGMSKEDLAHFFTMHGENKDRLSGRTGRGKFGTGKSAAFGIANSLRLTTRKNGLENSALLTREMIQKSSGQDIPLKWELRDRSSHEPNGTTILIEDIVLDKIRTGPTIDYLERHLQSYRSLTPEVAVNEHLCEPRQPEIDEEHDFSPTPEQQEILGDVRLFVRVARSPLPLGDQGVAVTAGAGNLIGIERGGIESRDFGSYLFGEVDVPEIENFETPIVPYDSSRNLQLNPQHPVVAVLVGFIGSKLEIVRKELVRKSKEAKKSEQAHRLSEEADKIASLLNSDFRTLDQRLKEIRAASVPKGSAGGRVTADHGAEDLPDEWIRGTQLPGDITVASPNQTGKGKGGSAPELAPTGKPNELGNETLDPVGGGDGKRKKPTGGFRVRYENLGKKEARSIYDAAALTILINLDHPVIEAALGQGSVDDIGFRRLSYEVAFTEYAMALGYHLCEQDPDIPPDDLLYEVRTTVNRISVAAAALYRS